MLSCKISYASGDCKLRRCIGENKRAGMGVYIAANSGGGVNETFFHPHWLPTTYCIFRGVKISVNVYSGVTDAEFGGPTAACLKRVGARHPSAAVCDLTDHIR